MRVCGRGYAGLERFTALMNLPRPVTQSNYDKIVKRIVAASKNVAEQTMLDACDELRGNTTPDNIINTAVSGDRTWQKRGHSSLNGVMTVISMDSGKILDIEVMSKTCKACKLHQHLKKTNPIAFQEWESNHSCKLCWFSQ